MTASSSISEAVFRTGHFSVDSRFHRPPHRIEDDYDIKDVVLGSGMSGPVRMATERGAEPRPERRQQFAVKALRLEDGAAPERRAELESEVALFLELDHPHIARLHDVYQAPDCLHLVMECLEGGELYDRVAQRKRYTEPDAAEAMRQMLLAVNYLHSHGIAHRDLKLENFLYDGQNSKHLKLIDFGFSKAWDPSFTMQTICGSLAYVAPEVLNRSYTTQCDLWSMGVIAFILLSGQMPFGGSKESLIRSIRAQKYTMDQERWCSISEGSVRFVQALLQGDPDRRLTAETALEHPWIVKRQQQADVQIDARVVEGLRQFGKASKFRRACLETMAWSLSNAERAQVREYFVSMDLSKQGTITLKELRQVLASQFRIPEREIRLIFEALDTSQDDSIHYSGFLAAMLSSSLALHQGLLRSAFRRFDADNTGCITAGDLRQVLSGTFSEDDMGALLMEVGLCQDHCVSYSDFEAYLLGTSLKTEEEAAMDSNSIGRRPRQAPPPSRL